MSEKGIDWGGRREVPTRAELEFAAELEGRCPGLDYWLHRDDEGVAWLLVSTDFVIGNGVRDTLRLDFDAAGIRGGWSPACLNWDAEMRAETAGIDTAGLDGIHEPAAGQMPAELARAAAEWFAEHRRRWPPSERGARWRKQ